MNAIESKNKQNEFVTMCLQEKDIRVSNWNGSVQARLVF